MKQDALEPSVTLVVLGQALQDEKSIVTCNDSDFVTEQSQNLSRKHEKALATR